MTTTNQTQKAKPGRKADPAKAAERAAAAEKRGAKAKALDAELTKLATNGDAFAKAVKRYRDTLTSDATALATIKANRKARAKSLRNMRSVAETLAGGVL